MLKKSFFTGIAILLPIAITIWIIDFFFELLTKPFLFIAKSVLLDFGMISENHPTWLFIARIGILASILLICLLLGFIAQKFFFKYVISSIQQFLRKIPIIKTVYQITEQTLESFLNQNKNPFSNVVTINFPDENSKSIAFLTGSATKEMLSKNPKHEKAVFVPTAPHPISGFLLFIPAESVTPIEISSEDAFKILFSCGSYEPKPSIKP